MNLFNTVKILYQEMYRQAIVNSSYVYNPKAKDVKIIVGFVSWLKKTYHPHQLNNDFLMKFFEFQFSRFVGVQTTRHGRPNGENRILLPWVVGQKACKAWQQRDPSEAFKITYRNKRRVHLQLSKVFAEQMKAEREAKYREMVITIQKGEETFKQKFHNQEPALVWCATNTTLFHPDSKWCDSCKFANQCKKLLMNNFPKIYEIRKKEYGERIA